MNVERMKSWQYFNFAIPLQTQYLSSQKRSSHSLNQLATTSYTLKDFFFQTCFHIFYFAFILRTNVLLGDLTWLTSLPPSLSRFVSFYDSFVAILDVTLSYSWFKMSIGSLVLNQFPFYPKWGDVTSQIFRLYCIYHVHDKPHYVCILLPMQVQNILQSIAKRRRVQTYAASYVVAALLMFHGSRSNIFYPLLLHPDLIINQANWDGDRDILTELESVSLSLVVDLVVSI